MSLRRSVFVSATTEGFAPWRAEIRKILDWQGIEALEQEGFSPESKRVQAEIDEKLSRATGVIFLVGKFYGYPMGEPREGQARLSYTQYEWFTANRLNKPRRVYLIKDSFFDLHDSYFRKPVTRTEPAHPDSCHFQTWQKEFWEMIDEEKVDGHRKKIGSPVELALSLAMINWNQWPLEQ